MTTLLKRNPGLARLVTCIALVAFATACTTMHPVKGSDPAAYAAGIEAGDTVRITRNDLSSVEFEVSALSDDGIGGDGVFVPWIDIRQIDVQRISATRTATVVVLGVAAAALAAVLIGGIAGPQLSFGGMSK